MKKRYILGLLLAGVCVNLGCNPDQRCYRDDDCDGDMICLADGLCGYKCQYDVECGSGFACVMNECVVQSSPEKKLTCPDDMALIKDAYCMDRYEASRPDATAAYEGTDSTMAVSKAGVIPWRIGDDNAAAQAACEAAGKRLCTPSEWEFSCHGVNNTVYGYGNDYDPEICNGIETFGNNFHLAATGAMENCSNGWGVYDLSGNLWEHTANGSGMTVRGGAFNCVDTRGNHQCSYVPNTWTPLALGFRCCSDGTLVEVQESEDTAQSQESGEVPEALNLWNGADGGLWNSQDLLLAWNPGDPDTASDYSMIANIVRSQKTESVNNTINIKRDYLLLASNDEAAPSADEWYDEYECVSPAEALNAVWELWMYQETRADALEVMKFAKKCNPKSLEVERGLGISYARMENYSWALKSFSKILTDFPDDCETLAWTAWVYMQMAMPDEVENTLAAASCDEEYLQNRIELIRAMNDITLDKPESAKKRLEKVYAADELAYSDNRALEALQKSVGTGSDPNMTWKVEIDGGYASNALSGSPNDPNLRGKDMGSPFLDGDARIMIDPWKRAFARSVLELQLTGQWLTSDDAKSSSYADIVLRPGVVLDWNSIKFGTYYRPEFLILHGGDKYDDGPILYYMSHRIELDLEINKWLYIFGGYGHRTFRQRVRTRDEADIGAGGSHYLGARFSLTWGFTYRHWFAVGDMYDLNGTNLSLALDYKIHDVLFRLNGSYAFDDYADSKGYFGEDARQDHGAKGTFQVWSPAWHGLRIGAQFKASRRWSSADDYEYQDYRGMISLKWIGELDFYSPRSMDDDISALPWDFESQSSSERIRDIIQQDEDMQRSSSCLQN